MCFDIVESSTGNSLIPINYEPGQMASGTIIIILYKLRAPRALELQSFMEFSFSSESLAHSLAFSLLSSFLKLDE